MSRVVCWFSCGAASAVAKKLAIQELELFHDIVIARCVVKEEHPDNDRFAADCAKWFGMPITNMIAHEYQGSVYDVIAKRRYISGIEGAPCTMLLKKRVRERFQQVTDLHVFGYCAEEQDRYDDFLDANNIDCLVPLIDRKLSHADCLGMIKKRRHRFACDVQAWVSTQQLHWMCQGHWWRVLEQGQDRLPESILDDGRREPGAWCALGVRMTRLHGERIFLDELPAGYGRYQDEPEVQCGIFCEAAQKTYSQDSGAIA